MTGAVQFRTVEVMDTAIEVRSLTMAYGDREVVHGIDLTVRRGEVFAVLGPNGAGKTTTIEILEGFRRRTGGVATVLGQDPQTAGPEWRERIGVVLQSNTPEAELTVAETLGLYGGFYRHPIPTARLLELCGLTEQANVRNKRLSGGQQRRLDVALALVGSPELVFLDEPTTGFDPAARRAAWETIAGLKALGTTIVLTTHYLEEAEYLADRIAVMRDGRIVAEGSPATLGGRDTLATSITFRVPSGVAVPPQAKLVSEDVENGSSRTYRIRTDDPTRALHDITAWAVQRGISLIDIDVHRPTLEDVYLRLTDSKEAVPA